MSTNFYLLLLLVGNSYFETHILKYLGIESTLPPALSHEWCFTLNTKGDISWTLRGYCCVPRNLSVSVCSNGSRLLFWASAARTWCCVEVTVLWSEGLYDTSSHCSWPPRRVCVCLCVCLPVCVREREARRYFGRNSHGNWIKADENPKTASVHKL